MTISGQLCLDLGLSESFVQGLAKSASYRYKRYTLTKRSGGEREIFHPSKELKSLQYWLMFRIIQNLPVSPAAFAYRKGLNTRRHAEAHRGARYLLRMDLLEFFPSLRDRDFKKYVEAYPALFPGWNDDDLKFFSSICFRRHQLPIGAPSSPGLSNVLMRPIDETLLALCDARGVRYSRYADDLYFSANEKGVLPGIEKAAKRAIEAADIPSGLRVNEAKARHSSKKSRQAITGIVLTPDGRVSAGRPLKRKIRSLIFRFETLDPQQRGHLAGLLGYLESAEPASLNSLVIKYGPDLIRRARHGA